MAKATKRKRPDWGVTNCADCGVETPKRGFQTKYCRPCSDVRDLKRKNLYAVTKGRAKFNKKRERWKAKGADISRAASETVAAWRPALVTLDAWYVRVEMPFGYSASKNHLFTNTRRGHTFLRDEARWYRAELTERIRTAVGERRVYQNKLWLDIYVQKSNHRGDAVNFLDLISDSVKDAIPLDDRWYSIRTLDWEVCKKDPMIFVGLGQADALDVQSCSSCGRFMTYDNFQSNKSQPNGINRVCRDCQLVGKSPKRREQSRRSQLQAAIEIAEGVFA